MFAVIGDFGDGGLGVGGNEHEVEALGSGLIEGFAAGHHAELFAFGPNDSQFAMFKQAPVDFGTWFGTSRTSSSIASDGCSPLYS